MSEMDDDSMVWIDRTVTRTRYSMWRTRGGLHYEDTYPHDGSDEEVSYRFDTVVSGIAFGAFPDLGEVWSCSGEPERTRVTLPVQHGRWVERRDQAASLDTPITDATANE